MRTPEQPAVRLPAGEGAGQGAAQSEERELPTSASCCLQGWVHGPNGPGTTRISSDTRAIDLILLPRPGVAPHPNVQSQPKVQSRASQSCDEHHRRLVARGSSVGSDRCRPSVLAGTAWQNGTRGAVNVLHSRVAKCYALRQKGMFCVPPSQSECSPVFCPSALGRPREGCDC